MEISLITPRLDLIAQIVVNLLAASITLIALVPVLVEMVRARNPSFLTLTNEQVALHKALQGLRISILLFGLDLVFWVVGNFASPLLFFYLMMTAFVMGLSALFYSCIGISKTCITTLK